jgi:hypothetical protein
VNRVLAHHSRQPHHLIRRLATQARGRLEPP